MKEAQEAERSETSLFNPRPFLLFRISDSSEFTPSTQVARPSSIFEKIMITFNIRHGGELNIRIRETR
jgi:hypothetical protein